MILGRCHLCRRERSLCRSHIIPEFLYDLLYDHKHRCFAISPSPEARERCVQQGDREPLLCEACEQRLSVHERYISETFRSSNLQMATDGRLQILAGLDYAHVRLFFLSILWRMSESSRDFFCEVDLGARAESLRLLILHDDPGEPHEYGFACAVPVIDGEFHQDLMLQPHWVRVDGRRVYRTILSGLAVFYYVSQQRLPKSQEAIFIQKDGSWGWLVADIQDLEFLAHWFGCVAAKEQAPAGTGL
jgi:hypothetical protein